MFTAAQPEADDYLYAEIEEWYTRLLLTAPPDMIDPVDYAGRVTLPPDVDGGVTISLPAEAVRLLSVRLMGWWCDARIVTDPGEVSSLLALQVDPYTRATPMRPLALARPGGFVTLYPAGPGDAAETLLCAARHPDGTYRFSDAALPSLSHNV